MIMQKYYERISTGVKGLDELIEGGLIPGRVYLITGPPGSGKTTFGMHFLLEGARKGEKVAYVSLIHKPEEVVKDMLRFDPSIYVYVNKWKLMLYDLGPVLWRESTRVPTWRSVLSRIREIVEDEGISRLVIDPLTAIDFPLQNPVEKRVELAKFIRGLEDLGVTAYLIAEMIEMDKYSEEHFLVSGIIILHYFMHQGRMIRAIQIYKMRGTRHDSNLKLLKFTDKGLVVYNKSPFGAVEDGE
uniref:Recombinase related n=2 Tax=Pyrococcus abyssi (strain GE5 / Orsay) TaxID=272844 RepID=G8ZIC2_PYRAB|nr:TPA: recombinase related [Pyrococcus abyssi GE5]